MIRFHTQGTTMPPISEQRVSAWIGEVAASYGRRIGEVNYIFTDDLGILAVNRHFLGHDYYTDVITFDYSEAGIIGGDIYISVDTVRSNAAQLGTDSDEELHRVIIHGILHLCGINDKGPGERERMEEAENEALSIL